MCTEARKEEEENFLPEVQEVREFAETLAEAYPETSIAPEDVEALWELDQTLKS